MLAITFVWRNIK